MSQAIEVENDRQEGDQEVQLQDQPSGKRRKKSPVWKDFEELESDDPSMTKAKCRICKNILTAHIKNGTSHLKRHIEMHDKGQASLDQYVLRAESNPDGSRSPYHPCLFSCFRVCIQYWKKGDNSFSKFTESRNSGGFSVFARLDALVATEATELDDSDEVMAVD